MSLDYAYEKLSVAVTSMATSTDSLQNRLANAYVYGFHTIGLNVNADLPPNLRYMRHSAVILALLPTTFRSAPGCTSGHLNLQ